MVIATVAASMIASVMSTLANARPGRHDGGHGNQGMAFEEELTNYSQSSTNGIFNRLT
jgi:hypothetical protein